MITKETAGVVLIVVGVIMQLLGMAYWLGWIRRGATATSAIQDGWSDVIKELIKVAPWVAVVGVINVFIGALLLGANLVGQTS